MVTYLLQLNLQFSKMPSEHDFVHHCQSWGIPLPSATSIRFVPLPTFAGPISSPPSLPGRSCHPETPVTTPASLAHPGLKGTLAKSESTPLPLATSSASARPSHKTRTPAACPSSGGRSSTPTGFHRAPCGRRPWGAQCGQVAAEEAESSPIARR